MLLITFYFQSYTIRNGVLSAMGEILLKCLSYENLSDDSKKKRDNILNHLEDHIYDVNAFVRTKVCGSIYLT